MQIKLAQKESWSAIGQGIKFLNGKLIFPIPKERDSPSLFCIIRTSHWEDIKQNLPQNFEIN